MHITTLNTPSQPSGLFDCIMCTPCSLLCTSGSIYKISYDLLQDYREFIVRSTDDSDCFRRSYNTASELYPRKALRPS